MQLDFPMCKWSLVTILKCFSNLILQIYARGGCVVQEKQKYEETRKIIRQPLTRSEQVEIVMLDVW